MNIIYYAENDEIVCLKRDINRIIGRCNGDPANPNSWTPIDNEESDEEAKEVLANGFKLFGLSRKEKL